MNKFPFMGQLFFFFFDFYILILLLLEKKFDTYEKPGIN